MLHLNFALNLTNLADQMIDEISRCWKNPFEAPVVIFPDPKLEQWFRLRWVQKKGVIANLEVTTIDKFLFRVLSHGDSSKQKISTDILRNVLLAFLKGNTLQQNTPILRELHSYLDGETGEIDDAKLFDFANTLAGLFLEYETSRPGNFISPLQSDHHEGLLAYWKQGDLRDFFSTKDRPVPKEKWQRHIYAKLFHNDGLGRDGVGGDDLGPGEPDAFGEGLVAGKKLLCHYFSASILIAPGRHSFRQMPQPLQKS